MCFKHSLSITDYLPLLEEGGEGDEGHGKEEERGGDEGGNCTGVQPHEEVGVAVGGDIA